MATKTLPAREKAQAGLWLLRQAILDLLRQPEWRAGMRPSQIREELGLKSEGDETTGVAYAIVKLMYEDGELARGDGPRPLYSLPEGAG